MDLGLQKAGVFKRFSAWMCDAFAFLLVALCIGLILSSVLGYDKNYQILVDAYGACEEKYGIDFDISEEEYEKLSDEVKNLYAEANAELNRDESVVRAYAMVKTLPLLLVSISVLVSSIILEFVVPLLFKNGQTLGKKLFGIAVVRTNGVKITGPVLFIRAILGKCTMETMVPVFIVIMILSGSLGTVGFVVLVLLAILQLAMLIITKTNSAIHDLLADTATVDFASQRIFESNEELLQYKQKVHEEAVRSARY